MPVTVDGFRFPHSRVLLPRTKLAYIHLGNLLTDAKRDRAARVFGYVAVWLPDELLFLYLQEGEVVNATGTTDGVHYESLPIAEAIARVPSAAEYGAICFHEAPDEQLACMFAAQCTPDEGWPPGVQPREPAGLFPYLNAQMYDGVVEIVADDCVNYLVFRNGMVQRAFLSGRPGATLAEQTATLFEGDPTRRRVRRWPVPPPLPVQAPPPLIAAYRELVASLVGRLVAAGSDGAPAIAEHARRSLVAAHPCLESFALNGARVRDPVVDAPTLTAGLAAWVSELLWTAGPSADVSPESLLAELTRERRHMFQSSGFCDALPWRVAW